ncbi:MAG: NTP transferase domain-containing protein [Deltaproteobacteria bacterium]|nr:NTP transferase domain-containing protein [Deltaproteobacteria bacterium]
MSAAQPTAVILAAGAGSRLGELGRRYSKAMVPLADRPLIAHVIERLRAAGVGPLVVVRHASDDALAEYLADRDVAVAVQQQRRGIADALAGALPRLGDAPAYLACACDSLFTPTDIAAVIAAGADGDAAIGVLAMDADATTSRSAVVVAGGRVTAVIEKPPPGSAPSTLVGAPLYWLPRAIDPLLGETARGAGGERYVTTALAAHLAAGGTLRAVRLSGRVEITTAADLAAAERGLRAGRLG